MEDSSTPFKVSDFRPCCTSCDNSPPNDEIGPCDYWMHPEEMYGNSILQRNYCNDCVKVFELYDGRKERVCKACLKYVGIFVVFPHLTEIAQIAKYNDVKFTKDGGGRVVKEVLKNFESLTISTIHEKLNVCDLAAVLDNLNNQYQSN